MADQTPAGANTADIEAARKDAATAAIKADRERRSAILALTEAKGREALAEHLHATTEMSVDQVKATLAAAPAAQAPSPEPKAEGKPEGQTGTDAAAYEASRLAGAGLGGKPQGASASAGNRLVERMKAQYGKGVN